MNFWRKNHSFIFSFLSHKRLFNYSVRTFAFQKNHQLSTELVRFETSYEYTCTHDTNNLSTHPRNELQEIFTLCKHNIFHRLLRRRLVFHRARILFPHFTSHLLNRSRKFQSTSINVSFPSEKIAVNLKIPHEMLHFNLHLKIVCTQDATIAETRIVVRFEEFIHNFFNRNMTFSLFLLFQSRAVFTAFRCSVQIFEQ